MEKPVSMSVKDYLMKKQSITTNIPLKTIEAVINNQFEGVNSAFKKHLSIEISGFAKFLFNIKKAEKALIKLKEKLILIREELDKCEEDKKRIWSIRETYTMKQIEILSTKVEKKY